MKNNQSGILLVELLMYILIVGILAAIGVPKVVEITKRQATRQEMSYLVSAIQLYEADKDVLPSSLSSLKPEYYADDKYKKDAWLVAYTYDKILRKLCSTNTYVGCKDF